MADLSTKERLQPSLLDRLTDNEPDSQQESRERRVLSPSRLRESVRRDLSWLLNASNLESVHDVLDYPAVQQSVVNFGIPALAGKTASDVDVAGLERAVREAVWRFEPRLIRSSVRVSAIADNAKKEERLGRYNLLSFYIDAMLWAQPIPLRLFLRTDVDLELGLVRVTELG